MKDYFICDIKIYKKIKLKIIKMLCDK
jgi:hypothetical protein